VNRYLLVDGNNLAMRALHASWNTSTLTNADGVPTAAVMIFINSLTKLIADETPTHIAIAWDGRSEFRRALLPSYKANRKEAPQELRRDDAFQLMMRFASFAGIQNHLDPVHEADDIIAGWWWAIEGSGEDTIIIASGDKDLLQLLGASPYGVPTFVHRFGDPEPWDDNRFAEVNGYEPERWSLVAALMGDASDNIEGIKGIGPKKAVKMLREHDWNLSEAVAERYPEELDRIETNFKLTDLQSFPQVQLSAPLPTELTVYRPEYPSLLDHFLDELELAEIQARYRRHALWSKPITPGRSLRPRTAEGRA
jgi:5'-3' exonuclease